ncbi:undecaprenyl/decaprenyl-phosphate alpha-N-acetylglucosaminyl 1-phosphate transferase [Halioglobus maricola]|uniref:Undecaprenyl/decaprenyl-phosphate alpha-N-acetylglucosaminyl 1-phosphate transferase n=1 Tax=Halioglobus maricola TaxID=2601894 RepID=A0A5P9NFR6_9GAMM|nr:MraY family glycosyltransferase [Halioglobus maricola]QFU74630.1 undecaprenyl/decaprenyl-phosphate alpha-N-acetylglucosaminyl 1-phosphate transferase [Halioglobus maricola]
MLAQFFTIFAAALIISRICISCGFRLGLVDRPDARKLHNGAVPLTGGIAIFLTIAFGTLVLGTAPYTPEMLLIATAVFLVGVIDDSRHINATLRLLIQFGCGALLATFGGIAIHNVGNLLAMGDIDLALLTVPLTALAVAGLANAYNMIDGIDGLAASMIALPLAVLYLLALNAGHPHTSFLLLMLVPIAVFLLFNLGPNNRVLPKMFLGDGGSITLGFLVTASLVFFSQGGDAVILPVTALWLVTVPLMDMLATMLRRLKNGKKLMEADRWHLHHTLQDLGLSARQALLVMLVYGCLAAALGLALEAIPEYLSLACYFLVFAMHCAFIIRSDRKINHP